MTSPQTAAPQKKPADLLAEWKALTPSQWEVPCPHKPLPDGAESQERPTAWQLGAPQAVSPGIGAAAQRTKELWDNWRSVSAQQQSNVPLDEVENLQHQMSQMQEGMPGRRTTSMEYGR